MPPILLSLILFLFVIAFFLWMSLKVQLSNAPGITHPVRNTREYISLSPLTRKKGWFEWVTGAPNVERTLANLPDSLKILDVSGTDIARLPATLPPGLVKLVARDCKNLEAIDSLPDSLVILDLWGCKKLARLPEQLPVSLQEMCLASIAVTRLPRLPDSLRSLDARCCPNLVEMCQEWPRFSGYDDSERPTLVLFGNPSGQTGGNLHWLNLCNTPVLNVLKTAPGNLPESIRRQLDSYGCAGWRHNALFGTIEHAGSAPRPTPYAVG